MKYLKYLFVLVLFVLLSFGVYKAIVTDQLVLALGTLSVQFVFAYLMLKTSPIKRFQIGGDKLSISINEEDNEPKA